jgi:hypothetical protein
MWLGRSIRVKYPLLLSDFNETCIFSTEFREKLKYQISSKSVHWKPSCSTRTNGRTDMTKVTVAFRSFANVPNEERSRFQPTQSV